MDIRPPFPQFIDKGAFRILYVDVSGNIRIEDDHDAPASKRNLIEIRKGLPTAIHPPLTATSAERQDALPTSLKQRSERKHTLLRFHKDNGDGDIFHQLC